MNILNKIADYNSKLCALEWELNRISRHLAKKWFPEIKHLKQPYLTCKIDKFAYPKLLIRGVFSDPVKKKFAALEAFDRFGRESYEDEIMLKLTDEQMREYIERINKTNDMYY